MNQHNDNLEDFFRKGLVEKNDFLLEDSDWDMPSDFVWDKIETNLPEEEKATSIVPLHRAWWAAAASVLLVLFAYGTYNSQQKIVTLEEQVAIQSSQLKDLQEQNNNTTVVFETANEKKSIAEKVTHFLAQAKEPFTGTGKELTTKSTDHKSTTTNPVKQQSSTRQNSYVRTVGTKADFPFTNLNSMFSSGSTVTTFQYTESFMVSSFSATSVLNDRAKTPPTSESIALASKASNVIPSTETIFTKEDSPAAILVNQPKKPRFYAGVFAGPSYWNAKLTEKNTEETISRGTLGNQTGIETGIKLGWQISDNWSLETGASIAKNTQERQHQMSFNFDPTRETPGTNGMLESTYEAKVNTNFGAVDVAFDVSRRPDSNLTAGETFNLPFNNEVSTTLVQVPLAARYGVQKGKFNVSASAGMLFSFMKDHDINLPVKSPMDHPSIVEERPRLKGNVPETKSMHYALQTGLQLAYHPTTTVELYVAPTYAHGLTPIAENDEVSTTLAQLSLQAGVNLRF